MKKMKVALYARVSTNEQEAENQVAPCLEFAKQRGFDISSDDIHLEKLSGFKDIERPEYEKVKEKARTGQIKGVIVWALDRWVRNRDTMLEDTTILKSYGCSIYSVKEAWLEAINIPGPMGKTIQDFLLGLIATTAELESQRKSDRVKIAYANRKGSWGRKSLPDRVWNEVNTHYAAGKSMRWIADNVHYYDKNKNEHKPGLGTVHKIIKEIKARSDTLNLSSSKGQLTNTKKASLFYKRG